MLRGAWKTAFCLVALALVSAAVGGLIGRRLAYREFNRRSDPVNWNETALRELEQKLKPTPPQMAKIREHMDRAVGDMVRVRTETIERSTAIIVRLVDQVEKELTPEQQRTFATMKPKPAELSNLNLLRVNPPAKAKP